MQEFPLGIAVKPALYLCGAFVGYLVVMLSNPVRRCFGDGWRVIRRYSAFWMVLGGLGFAHALFDVGVRWYLESTLPDGAHQTEVAADDAGLTWPPSGR
jgi:hypothetical protein